jgi:hypothetical protein
MGERSTTGIKLLVIVMVGIGAFQLFSGAEAGPPAQRRLGFSPRRAAAQQIPTLNCRLKPKQRVPQVNCLFPSG